MRCKVSFSIKWTKKTQKSELCHGELILVSSCDAVFDVAGGQRAAFLLTIHLQNELKWKAS